jgi:glucose 1-dehydrogenase
MLLEGRKAIVTGASSGIGKATAHRLAAEGARVCLNYYSDADKAGAEQGVKEIGKAGGRAIALQADVGSEDDVIHLVSAAAKELGGLDLLINNAGIENQVALTEMPLASWERVLRTNLTGAFLCLREAAKLMIAAKGGVIVNVSSVHEFIPWPGYAHYCSSKGGLKLLMETAARELASGGVRVVNVAPGAIATPINERLLEHPTEEHAVEEEIPLGRMGKAEEVAGLIAWVASDEAGYVTGTTLVVDGGMSLYPKFV